MASKVGTKLGLNLTMLPPPGSTLSCAAHMPTRPSQPLFILKMYITLCIHDRGVGVTCATRHMKSQDNFVASVLLLHPYVGSGDGTQGSGLAGRDLPAEPSQQSHNPPFPQEDSHTA